MAQILDPWGNPVSSAALKRPAMGPTITGVRDTFDAFIASGLTPAKMARILRDAALGEMQDFLTLAEEMEERETQYAAVLSTRKRAIQSIEPQVEAASDDPDDVRIADAVRDRIADHPDLYDLIGDCLDALSKGYSVTEIVWTIEAGCWIPERFEWHDPRLFHFDRETRKELRKRVQASFNGAPLEPFKFIRHIPRLKSGIPARNGLARLALWCFLLKSYSLKDWAAFLEVHGMPLRLGRYGQGASIEDKRVLLRAVRDLGADAAAIIPKEMDIEFVETKGFSEKPFEGFALYLDKALSKAIIGQTMTADAGTSGSLAQAKVHENVRTDIKKADARQLEGTLARDLVRPFVDINFGPRTAYPKLTFPVSEPEDIKTISDSLKSLVPLGLKVQMSEVRDRLGFSDPEDGAECLGIPETMPGARAREGRSRPTDKPRLPSESDDEDKPAPSLNRFHLKGCPCCGAPERLGGRPSALALNAEAAFGEDELDRLVEEGLTDWEPDLKPLVDAIADAARRADGFDGFQAELNRLTGTLPTGDLATRIAIQAMKARGLGQILDLGEVSDDPSA
jgi:phage gp29-like protein